MKTIIFKKSSESKKSELMEMSKEELKSIQGGIWYLVRREDGSIGLVFRRD
ncbi:MAG: bacteriocin [Bacteroidales bacterium]|jgi:bacteriocin-like protein|nr:bacteriocin [Bacteroidales bacterium]